MASRLEATPREGACAGASWPSASREAFLEHVNSVLRSPLPVCLQATDRPAHAAALRHMDTSRLLRLLHPGAGSHHPSLPPQHREGLGVDADGSRESQSGASSSLAARTSVGQPHRPFYERLLEEGRLAVERREELVARANAELVADMRPAPSLPPHYKPKRLPPDGQRIEDKLLQRAREHAEVLEHRRVEAQKRREEELQRDAPFRPRISAHAKAVQPKYTRTPQDFEEWRARRKQELEEARRAKLAAEEAEHREVPDINPRSEKLAARRKRREEQLDARSPVAADASVASESRTSSRARARRSHSRDASVEGTAHKPTISEFAARLSRPEAVSDRLYADASALELRKLERARQHHDSVSPFQPIITAKAAASAPRYRETQQPPLAGTSGGGVAVTRGSSPRPSTAPAKTAFTPVINPVSEAIARRLPESSVERLRRPVRRGGYSASSSATSSNGDALSYSSADGWERVVDDEACSADEARGTRQVTPLPPHVADAFIFYERRRKKRLEELRQEQERRQRDACTFAPRTNAAGPVRDVGGMVRRHEEWRETRERRLEMLRALQHREEQEEARRGRQWREDTGLYADRPRPSYPGSRSDSHGEATPERHAQPGVPSRLSSPLQRQEMPPRQRGPTFAAQRVVNGTSPSHPPFTIQGIYESVYHVDPTSNASVR